MDSLSVRVSVWPFDVLLSNKCSQLQSSVVWNYDIVMNNMHHSDWKKTNKKMFYLNPSTTVATTIIYLVLAKLLSIRLLQS